MVYVNNNLMQAILEFYIFVPHSHDKFGHKNVIKMFIDI